MNVDLTALHELGNGGLANTEFTDGKHIVLDCSKCGKKLADLWITQPDLDVHTKVVAECNYCGDRSYEKEIHGKFHTGITTDSALADIKHEFVDGGSKGTGIYQKMRILTKRLK